MNTKSLEFIKDNDIADKIKVLLDKTNKAEARKDIYKNVIDPFSAIFDAARQDISLDEWVGQEKSRQIQKSLQNYVGEFHQSIIGCIGGWENLGTGGSLDLRNRNKKIVAEIKNKHNTMNSTSQLGIYDKLQRHLDYDESYKGYTGYCVTIVPKSFRLLNSTFHPSERGTQRPKREDIRIIDGKSFYQIVTGDVDSLQKLYNRIPFVISHIIGIPEMKLTASKLFEDFFKRAYLGK